MSWKLNDVSPVIGQPRELKQELKKYQLAALYRCLTIEKNNKKYGFMADIAGFGKTGVMLSLIAADKSVNGRTQNLIIVPQNIINQWVKEVEKFTGNYLTVKCLTEYSDISMLMFESDILREYDILITTITYYNTIVDILEQNFIPINRLIYDEIDTMNTIISKIEERKFEDEKNEQRILAQETTTGVKNRRLYNKVVKKELQINMTWFISASLYNSLSEENGFTFMGKNIPLNELGNLIVKCEHDFIEKYKFNLDPPKNVVYKCDSLLDIYDDLVSVENHDIINSLSFQKIYSKITDKRATNELEVVKIIIEEYVATIKNNNEMLEKINNIRTVNSKLTEQKQKLLKEKEFFEIILDSYHTIKCKESYCNKVECINKHLDKLYSENTNSKITFFKSICDNLYSENKRPKVLIFSDFQDSFKIVEQILSEKNISYTELSKGNVKEINMAIDDYKKKDIDILLIDSSNHGAGMNLENTDVVLFLHRTNETLNKQVIGRAQRPGRVGQLTVINMYNKNEII